MQCNLVTNYNIKWSAPGFLAKDVIVGPTDITNTQYFSINGIINIRSNYNRYYKSSFLTLEWEKNVKYYNISFITFGCMPDIVALNNSYTNTIDITCKFFLQLLI